MRDQLAADLHAVGYCADDENAPQAADFIYHAAHADRLIALGWTRLECWCLVESPEQPGGGVNPHCPQHGDALDEERLARALDAALCRVWDRIAALRLTGPWVDRKRQVLDIIAEERAAIAKAYREDTDATD